jgi:hypothetical protein
MTDEAKIMVAEYGDDAYYKAVEMTVAGVLMGETEGSERFAAVARELMELGYHKRGEPALRRITGRSERLIDRRGCSESR